jgi:hypothetical protein
MHEDEQITRKMSVTGYSGQNGVMEILINKANKDVLLLVKTPANKTLTGDRFDGQNVRGNAKSGKKN